MLLWRPPCCNEQANNVVIPGTEKTTVFKNFSGQPRFEILVGLLNRIVSVKFTQNFVSEAVLLKYE
jgi:hypothetical protein